MHDISEEVGEDGATLTGLLREGGQRVSGQRIHETEWRNPPATAYRLKSDPAIRVENRTFKMSKSRGNVVNPDDIVADYGADTFRLYEMYLGPLEAQKPWNTRDIVGMSRFLNSVWRNLIGEDEEADDKKSITRVR